MTGRYFLAGAAFASAALAWSGTYAAPVYIGLQEAGVNGGAITQEATGSGSASITNLIYGNAANGIFQLTVSAQGTPPLPEPDLNSTSVSATATFPGTISIYVTELNQIPSQFPDTSFQSLFQSGVQFSPGTTVVESTYMDVCSSAPCNASYIFDTATQLSMTTFTSAGSVIAFSNQSALLTGSNPIEITEKYTITFTNQNSSVDAAIDLRAVPEPASIGLFVSGLLGLGAIRRRRKS